MNVRREPAKRPHRPVQHARGAPQSQGGGARATGGGGWSRSRQVIEVVLLGILALTGLAMVAVSSKGVVSTLVLSVAVVSVVVAIGIARALWRARR